MELVYLNTDTPTFYPVGAYFSSHNWQYIVNIADKIMELVEDNSIPIILIGRGSSGAIIAGAVAAILYQHNRYVRIYISRKSSENCHGTQLDGLYSDAYKDNKIIVVDDFLDTGSTILAILEDLREKFRKEVTLDMLCIGNYLDYSSFKEEGGERYWSNWSKIAENFRYIVCNNPEYR